MASPTRTPTPPPPPPNQPPPDVSVSRRIFVRLAGLPARNRTRRDGTKGEIMLKGKAGRNVAIFFLVFITLPISFVDPHFGRESKNHLPLLPFILIFSLTLSLSLFLTLFSFSLTHRSSTGDYSSLFLSLSVLKNRTYLYTYYVGSKSKRLATLLRE